jgi:Phosphatidylserine/phosphatidylglycerophosphate/cardiolipin synthases and related enzymes
MRQRLAQQHITVDVLVRYIMGITLLAQLVTASILLILTAIRDHHKKKRSFPTIDLEEVQVGSNRLQIYSYGEPLYAAMFEAIDNAKEAIYLESYIWKDDEAGRNFRDHLARKAAAGVEVYVIFDRIGNLVVPHSFKASFDRRIHMLEFQALRSIPNLFDIRRYSLDHRKLLTVDGKIGFIGGYNIGSLYESSWRDTHLRIKGTEVAELARSFADFWNRICPAKDKIKRHYLHRFNPLITLHENDALRMTFPIRDMYIEAINRAEHTIYLSNAYFIPDHILLGALQSAAQRGVDVRILVPWVSNHVLADWMARGYFAQCLEAGIHILGYMPAMLHAKTCTIDGQWSTIGTANMDRLSSIGNYEINVEIYSHEFAQQMERLFESDSTDIITLTPAMWHNRKWYTKLSEHILAPLHFML